MRKLALILAAFALAIVPSAFLSQAQAVSRYDVTLHVSKTDVALGTPVVFSGKVSPTAKGSLVSIQYLFSDQESTRWVTIAHATVQADGTYARSVPPRASNWSYRVFKPAGAGRSSGASPQVVIRAYSWTHVVGSLLERYGWQYTNQYGPQTVAGTPVAEYWSTTASAHGESRWSTHQSCKRLRVDVGLDDRSDAGADAQFRIHFDGDLVYSLRVKKGTKVSVDLPIPRADTSSIKFSAEARNKNVPVYVNASNPRVYCALPVLED
ncbi:NPCBM/NEW2 domain-containing protein [Aeromicrobium ginsengisoli]|uniref:Glycosyl hydrolase family 98 putative carbohydrate-binding module domain-containing protein n=1 Tax=Aeromicrobium ginsengisoli TaxID=363867 RepID=A0A5M4FHW0_9ACTN|nr:NPCBM/NEW2 domain-containing protein [Aeromicrobium ginsengisoli]KAA1399303.1 hypothetical protein ESP70_000565 [Aeromicrobium ginsengisoli]